MAAKVWQIVLSIVVLVLACEGAIGDELRSWRTTKEPNDFDTTYSNRFTNTKDEWTPTDSWFTTWFTRFTESNIKRNVDDLKVYILDEMSGRIKLTWSVPHWSGDISWYVLCTTRIKELNKDSMFQELDDVDTQYASHILYLTTYDTYYCKVGSRYDDFQLLYKSNMVSVTMRTTTSTSKPKRTTPHNMTKETKKLSPLVIIILCTVSGIILVVVIVSLICCLIYTTKKGHVPKFMNCCCCSKRIQNTVPARAAQAPSPITLHRPETTQENDGNNIHHNHNHHTTDPLPTSFNDYEMCYVGTYKTPHEIATAPPPSYSRGTAPSASCYYLPMTGANPPPVGDQQPAQFDYTPYYTPMAMPPYYNYPTHLETAPPVEPPNVPRRNNADSYS